MVKNPNFSRSKYMKNVHAQAKREQQFYKDLTGNDSKYNEFLKSESPLDTSVVAYDVSYQMTYMSTSNNFEIQTPQTFRVYAMATDSAEQNIVTNTIEAVKNMKAPGGQGLNSGLQRTIDSNLNVTTRKVPTPRGFELSEQKTIDKDVIEKIRENGIYVETMDEGVTIQGGKKRNTNSAHMKVDLTRYIE